MDDKTINGAPLPEENPIDDGVVVVETPEDKKE